MGSLFPQAWGRELGWGQLPVSQYRWGQRFPALGCFWLQRHELKRATTF